MRRTPKHEHQLKVASYDIPDDATERVTIVLLRCDCGTGTDHLQTTTLKGHFVMDALLGLEAGRPAPAARTAPGTGPLPEPEGPAPTP